MIPDFLTEFKSELEKYKTATIKIQATPLKENQTLKFDESKFLGKPYLPIDFDYPKDKNGKPMVLWAQINFAEVPKYQNYPEKGILQFFVSPTDWYDVNDYKIIFHENLTNEIQTDFSFLTEDLYEDSPIWFEHKLVFIEKIEYGSSEDHNFDMNFNGKDFWEYWETLSKENQKLINEIIDGSGHKIGGYAYFTQGDPRDYNKEHKNDVLLLQIDSDEEIMFGDSGIANFFISKDDLTNRNFEKAWFYWDCC